jgi:hypothetical protein
MSDSNVGFMSAMHLLSAGTSICNCGDIDIAAAVVGMLLMS